MFYLNDGSLLLRAVSWLNDTENVSPLGSANKYILWKQISDNESVLIGRGQLNVWYSRIIQSQAEIGSVILFSAEELLEKAEPVGTFKTEPITVTLDQTNKANFKIGKNKTAMRSTGNLTVTLYHGDVTDFELPEIEYTKEYIFGFESFYEKVKLVSEFSSFKNEKNSRAALIEIKEGKLIFTSNDKSNGYCYLQTESTVDYEEEERFFIRGRYLALFESIPVTYYTVNTNETMVRIKTPTAEVVCPKAEEYMYADISSANQLLFSKNVNVLCRRTLPLADVENALELTKPLKKSTRKAVYIEEIETDLVFSRTGDPTKKEIGIVNLLEQYLEEIEQPFRPISINYDYMESTINSMKLIQRQLNTYKDILMSTIVVQQIEYLNNTHLIISPSVDTGTKVFLNGQKHSG